MKIDPKAAREWLAQQPNQGFITSSRPELYTQPEIKTEQQHQRTMTVLDQAIVSSTLFEIIEQAQASTGRSLRETSRRAAMSHTQLLSIKKQAEKAEVRNLARIADAMGYELHIAFVPRDHKLKRLEAQL
jgi:hypothetical protein